MLKLLHVKILIAVWIGVIAAGFVIPKHLLAVNLLSTRVISWPTFLWICMCILAFWGGTFIERSLYAGTNKTAVRRSTIPAVPFQKLLKSLKTFKWLLAIVTGVILFRFAWCVQKVGSFKATLIKVLTDPIHFKFNLWQEATVHGLASLSDLIVGCTIFAFAFFALVKKYQANVQDYYSYGYDEPKMRVLRKSAVKSLILSLIVLTIYFLLSNERIAFIGGFLGGFVAYLLIKKSFPVKKLLYLALFLISLWIYVEGSRGQYFGTETWAFILEHAKDRLLLYFVAGLRNIDTVVNYLPNQTYGWYTFNFLLHAFGLDFLGDVKLSLYGRTPYHIIGGYGVIPVFGVAFADYNYAALGYFLVLGFIYQRLHRHAILNDNFLAIQTYAYFLVALLISFVAFLPTLARFWVNIFALFFINKSIRFGNFPSLKVALSRNKS